MLTPFFSFFAIHFYKLTIILLNFPGNQGWPSVAYNERADEYMIAFQFRAGVMQYFSNKYFIISQRVRSWQTERAAGPALLVKANGPAGPTDWAHATEPLIEYNSVTGTFYGNLRKMIGNVRKSSENV